MYKRKKRLRLRNKGIVFILILISLVVSGIFLNKRFNLYNSIIRRGILFIDESIVSLGNENNSNIDDMNQRISELEQYEIENIELKKEIDELKKVLNINKLLSDKKYINASVINRNLSYWLDNLVIDKGFDDGVLNNLAVISNGGLVGVTSNVNSYSSNVSLFCNNVFPINVSVKITVDDNEYFGILNNYNNGLYEIVGIVENVDIPEGSLVTTSGLGNVFPSGLLVGEVFSVSKDNFDLAKVVKVSPSVNFDDISYVTVVMR